MKSRLIITLITAVVSLSALMGTMAAIADTCPAAGSFDPNTPPAGWSMILPPIVQGQKYQFNKAIHSLNPAFYYLQVVCVYMACLKGGCPGIEIVSDITYDLPVDKTSPWNKRPTILNTLVCEPGGNNPQECVFSNSKPLNPR
jgi:hypothetical protein